MQIRLELGMINADDRVISAQREISDNRFYPTQQMYTPSSNITMSDDDDYSQLDYDETWR